MTTFKQKIRNSKEKKNTTLTFLIDLLNEKGHYHYEEEVTPDHSRPSARYRPSFDDHDFSPGSYNELDQF